jgi:hypothetical protein
MTSLLESKADVSLMLDFYDAAFKYIPRDAPFKTTQRLFLCVEHLAIASINVRSFLREVDSKHGDPDVAAIKMRWFIDWLEGKDQRCRDLRLATRLYVASISADEKGYYVMVGSLTKDLDLLHGELQAVLPSVDWSTSSLRRALDAFRRTYCREMGKILGKAAFFDGVTNDRDGKVKIWIGIVDTILAGSLLESTVQSSTLFELCATTSRLVFDSSRLETYDTAMRYLKLAEKSAEVAGDNNDNHKSLASMYVSL